jgi:hypothetical protein
MRRGGVGVGQIPKRAPKVTLPYRADPAQVAAIDEVVREEGGEEQVSRSEVIEYLVGLALPLYWARADVGHARIDAMVEKHGGDARAAYAELLTLGLVAMDLDPKLLREAVEERNRRVHTAEPRFFIVASEADAEKVEGYLKRLREAHVHALTIAYPGALEALTADPPENAPGLVLEERRKRMREAHVQKALGEPKLEDEKSTTGIGPRRTAKLENVPGEDKDTEDYHFHRTRSPGRSRRPQPPKPK